MKRQYLFAAKARGGGSGVALPVLVFLAIGALFLLGLGSLGETTREEQLRSVRQAVTKATVQCYALEGQYAPSLGYLEQRYGLVVDRERYIVQYDIFASNRMPQVLVLEREPVTPGVGGSAP